MDILKRLKPPKKWKLVATLLSALLMGSFVIAFYVSNAVSYISDKPEACVNCHIMTPHYATWFHSSHREKTTCNDCHVPQDNVFRKYYFKGKDGIRHATMFTLRKEPQVFRLNAEAELVVQENCIRCHSNTTHDISHVEKENYHSSDQNKYLCWNCHRNVPHGNISSQSSTPGSLIPNDKKITPEWMEKLIKESEKK